ncbi:hypothetical protein [Microbacterium sp.]|uniref:hypothetical protein n=1 Tax=Microbacterium sp. TaxID=51671 RepID=UPI0039E35BD3
MTAPTPTNPGRFAALRSLWDRVTEPRRLKALYAFLYAVATGTGVVTLLFPPQSVEGVLGRALVVVWSSLFIAGGVGGMSTVLNGRWKWERWSIGSILMGIGIYGAVVLSLHFTSSGSRLTQLGVLVLAAGLFVVKLELIRWYSFDPRR